MKENAILQIINNIDDDVIEAFVAEDTKVNTPTYRKKLERFRFLRVFTACFGIATITLLLIAFVGCQAKHFVAPVNTNDITEAPMSPNTTTADTIRTTTAQTTNTQTTTTQTTSTQTTTSATTLYSAVHTDTTAEKTTTTAPTTASEQQKAYRELQKAFAKTLTLTDWNIQLWSGFEANTQATEKLSVVHITEILCEDTAQAPFTKGAVTETATVTSPAFSQSRSSLLRQFFDADGSLYTWLQSGENGVYTEDSKQKSTAETSLINDQRLRAVREILTIPSLSHFSGIECIQADPDGAKSFFCAPTAKGIQTLFATQLANLPTLAGASALSDIRCEMPEMLCNVSKDGYLEYMDMQCILSFRTVINEVPYTYTGVFSVILDLREIGNTVTVQFPADYKTYPTA